MINNPAEKMKQVIFELRNLLMLSPVGIFEPDSLVKNRLPVKI